MKLFATLKRKIKLRLVRAVLHEFHQEQAARKSELLSGIGYIGSNSFFWGDNHQISRPDLLRIGENVHINSNCFIESDGGVEIGDNTHISRNFVLCSVNPNFEGEAIPCDDSMSEKPVSIGKNVWIGTNVCVAPGTVIGDGAIVGMGTTVSGRVPPLAIIGSQKWRSIGNRDREHYELLERYGKYGAADGVLYNRHEKLLFDIGERKSGRRSTVEVVKYGSTKAIRKVFHRTREGAAAREKELLAIDLLSKFKWFPDVLDTDSESIVYEYVPNQSRLDQIVGDLDVEQTKDVLDEIVSALIDLYASNVAHCDFHSRNLFYSHARGLVVCDFESIQETGEGVDFFESYDVIGVGLESPYNTGNMCILSEDPCSIGRNFQIKDVQHLRRIVEESLKRRLRKYSGTFYTRRYSDGRRHKLANDFIYSSIDTKHVTVDASQAQRRMKRRFEQFGVTRKTLEGRRVLDVGSNIGGTSFEISRYRPLRVTGLEYDKEKVEISTQIAKLNRMKDVHFKQCDVEGTEFMRSFNEKFDVVFCLSVFEHLDRKSEFVHNISGLCEGEMFFEGNAGTDVDAVCRMLLESGFAAVDYVGMSDDEKNNANNNRPLIHARKANNKNK